MSYLHHAADSDKHELCRTRICFDTGFPYHDTLCSEQMAIRMLSNCIRLRPAWSLAWPSCLTGAVRLAPLPIRYILTVQPTFAADPQLVRFAAALEKPEITENGPRFEARFLFLNRNVTACRLVSCA